MASLRIDSVFLSKQKTAYIARLQIIGTRRTFTKKIQAILLDQNMLNKLPPYQASSLATFNILSNMKKNEASNDGISF